jgi:hypothetical protein
MSHARMWEWSELEAAVQALIVAQFSLKEIAALLHVDYKSVHHAAARARLKVFKLSKHPGVSYPCPECGYNANDVSDEVEDDSSSD